MPRWTPPVPERFGQVPSGHGIIFTCRHCGRHRAVAMDAALKAWGEKGIIADVAARAPCMFDPCRKRGKRGHHVDLSPIRAGLGRKRQPTQVEQLLAAIRAVKPSGTVE